MKKMTLISVVFFVTFTLFSTKMIAQGQGIASFSCIQLIAIAKTTDPKIIITAKTAPENNASTKILKRNGFEFTGIVQDEGIGDAWEWVYQETLV